MEKFIIKEMIIDEATELELKLNELNDFLICGKSDQIDPIYKSLLTMQSSAMGIYLECLKNRINLL